MLGLLQHRAVWAAADLAKELGVTERTVRRDIQRLRDLGYTIRGSAGVDGGYRLDAGNVIPPLLLDESEAMAIGISLTMAAREAVDDLAEPALRALGKIARVMPPTAERQLDAVSGAITLAETSDGGVPPSTVLCVSGAIQSGHQLRFDYTPPGRESAPRRAEPQRIVVRGRTWYLFAWDLDRDDWRTFRLDRMSGTRASTFTNARRSAPDAEAYIRRSFENLRAGGGEPAVIDFLVPIDEVRQVVPKEAGELTVVDERTTRLTTDSIDYRWILYHVQTSLLPCRIVGPPSLTEMAAEQLRRLSAALAPS